MRYILVAIALALFGLAARAEETINFNYDKPADVTEVISDYAKISGTRWIIDPMVRGKITIVNPQKISQEEAFNQLSGALAINGLAYTEDGGTYRVGTARQIQRSNIPVVKEVPSLRPERMVTWIVTLKNISAEDLMRSVRMLSSKDGECASMDQTNQLVFTDYTSSIVKIAKVIAEMDQPVDAQRKKVVATQRNYRKTKSQNGTGH